MGLSLSRTTTLITLCIASIAMLPGLLACSSATRPASSEELRPTSPLGKPVGSLEAALSLARLRFTASPPWAEHDIESMHYVDTTLGRARDLFDPDGSTPKGRWFADAPATSPVWAMVARGNFRWKSALDSRTPGPSYSTVWLVIAKGEKSTSDGSANSDYDLTKLGSPLEVYLPLPQYPTPVGFEDSQ